MPDCVGQQIGNYRLTHLIGRGGYAEVYLAEHILSPHLKYAIKILMDSYLDAYQRDQFLAEACTIASLQRLSDHIVQVRDFGILQSGGTESNIPYLVMEYAAAGTLRELYPPGQSMALDRIIFYVNQIAEALQCAHEQNPPVVHRDIKPENMLLRTLDHTLLSDFGIAITSQTGILPHGIGSAGVIGTAAYIAPERLEGQVRRASDQYSLGVVVYEWLCGVRPFGGSRTELCYFHLKTSPPPLHENYPYIKPEIEAVVRRALAKKPEERYPDIQSFAQALMIAAQQRDASELFPTQIAVEDAMPSKKVQSVPCQVNPTVMPTLRGFADITEVDSKLLPKESKRSRKSAAHQKRTEQPPLSFSHQQPTITPKPRYVRAKQPTARLQYFFDFSSAFAHDRRYSLFRNTGIIMNILATTIIVSLMQIIWAFPIGLLYTWILFALCIRAVEEILATFFGILLALYWGWLGWLLGECIADYGNVPDHVLMSIGGGSLFFIISLTLHMRYILRKNS